MKYSVFVEVRMFATVEVEAEDHTDAAQKIALATLHPEFFEQTSFDLDGVECEVSAAADVEAVHQETLSMDEFDRRVVIFNEETVHGWLSPINGYTLNVDAAGGDV